MSDKEFIGTQRRCSEIPFGTYECCYQIYLPWLYSAPWQEEPTAKLACIDKCLLPEILKLWEAGVKTTGCCCGHGREKPYIGVADADIHKMKSLGYQTHPHGEDTFIPKTKLVYDIAKCTEV